MEFEELYRTYFKDVYRYLVALCGDTHLSEEVTSDTFFRAMDGLSSFRGDCSPRVWLCQIAKNCCYSKLKKRKREVPTDFDEIPPAGEDPSPAEEVAEQEQRELARRILLRLSDPYREVVLLRIYADLSFREIGELLGKSENWACVTYHRARQKLRELWRQSYGE